MSPLPGEDGQQPVLLLVSKDLSDILPETQREAVLIGACPEDWCSERLCREGATWRDENEQMQGSLNNRQVNIHLMGNLEINILENYKFTSKNTVENLLKNVLTNSKSTLDEYMQRNLLQNWSNNRKHLLNVCAFVTYSGPVLPYKPQVVAEEGQNTDAEHGRHKKKEQDVEFGLSVRQLVLGRRGERERELKTKSH